jgi:uncharacterized protein YcaQ
MSGVTRRDGPAASRAKHWPMADVRLTNAQARRVALAAQGFADARPPGAVTMRHLRRVFAHVGVVQIDSVNVLVRAHYLPLFSRLGPYDAGLLDRAAYGKRRELFEYWGHAASYFPLALFPLMRWRMERARQLTGIYSGLAQFAREHRKLLASVLAAVAERGPVSAGDLEPGGSTGSWWGWSDTKHALEYLFWAGRVTTAFRRGFERVYDLTERVLPAELVAAAAPPAAAAQRELLRIAARSLGVATERDLRDYFRLRPPDAKPRLAELVEAGELVAVDVDGWKNQAYALPDLRVPRRVDARALLAPFDSLVWERARTERLFAFDYRLEIYTPKHKRVHGYYVLPFLLGDGLAARVDLKADRAAGVLRAHAVHVEPQRGRAEVLAALEPELAAMAGWLGLADVALPPRRGGKRPAATA